MTHIKEAILAKNIAISGGNNAATDPEADTCPVDRMQTQGRMAERQLLCLLEVMRDNLHCCHANIALFALARGNAEIMQRLQCLCFYTQHSIL